MTQALQTLRDKPSARWTALILLAMAMFFSYIFMDILSPLKDILETQRHWDSTAFGTYAGSETFLNVFIFFLIIAGIIRRLHDLRLRRRNGRHHRLARYREVV